MISLFFVRKYQKPIDNQQLTAAHNKKHKQSNRRCSLRLSGEPPQHVDSAVHKTVKHTISPKSCQRTKFNAKARSSNFVPLISTKAHINDDVAKRNQSTKNTRSRSLSSGNHDGDTANTKASDSRSRKKPRVCRNEENLEPQKHGRVDKTDSKHEIEDLKSRAESFDGVVEEAHHNLVRMPFDDSKYTIGISIYDTPSKGKVLEAPEYVTDIFQRLYNCEVSLITRV